MLAIHEALCFYWSVRKLQTCVTLACCSVPVQELLCQGCCVEGCASLTARVLGCCLGVPVRQHLVVPVLEPPSG